MVDDHGIFREGTALLLKSFDATIDVVHARSARGCMEHCAQRSFDLVLLDLGLPDRPGLDALADLKRDHPDIPVVVLSGQEDRDTMLEAIRRGAMGFIPKSSEDPQVLLHALKLAVSGAVTMPAALTQARSDGAGSLGAVQPSGAAARAQDLALTPRQLDVLRLLVQGLPNKSIARHMEIAESTARDYVSDLLAMFRVTNRTQLVLEVARRGLRLGPPAPRA